MRTSMKNKNVGKLNRADAVTDAISSLYSFQDSIYDDASKISETIQNVELLVYGFGFKNDPVVRDLLKIDQSTSSTTPLSALTEDRDKYRAHLDSQKEQMFGSTPLKGALLTLRERVLAETSSGAFSYVILFLVSDGDPTDCNDKYAIALTNQMKREGFCIISGFITDADLPNPKALVSSEHSSWRNPARTMFRISSPLPKISEITAQLHKLGWQTEDDCRMFAQINQSENLGEFLNTMLLQLIATVNK